jgi:hypothetical protein
MAATLTHRATAGGSRAVKKAAGPADAVQQREIK